MNGVAESKSEPSEPSEKASALSAIEDRQPISIFLASPQDLIEERSRFEEIIGHIAAQPNVARQYKLNPVHWQQTGGDAGNKDLQTHIKSSIEFQNVPIIVLVVGPRIGPGTQDEYDTAVSLRINHGQWPKIIAFFKCKDDGVTLLGDEKVRTLHSDITNSGRTAPINYRNLDELRSKLAVAIESILISAPVADLSSGESLRRILWVVWSLTIGLTIVTLMASTTMSFPRDGVNWSKVFWILVAPPIHFIAASVGVWSLFRFVREFRYAWNSAAYSDERIYRVFRNVLPTTVIPKALRGKFPQNPVGVALNWLILLLVCVGPIIAQYRCIYDEILKWDFVVSPHEIETPENDPSLEPIESRHVERGPLRWPFVIQNNEVRKRYVNGEVLYVYATGKFGDERKRNEPFTFRHNKGPEVFLPLQPRIYIGLMYLTAAFGISMIIALLRLPRTSKSGEY